MLVGNWLVSRFLYGSARISWIFIENEINKNRIDTFHRAYSLNKLIQFSSDLLFTGLLTVRSPARIEN